MNFDAYLLVWNASLHLRILNRAAAVRMILGRWLGALTGAEGGYFAIADEIIVSELAVPSVHAEAVSAF